MKRSFYVNVKVDIHLKPGKEFDKTDSSRILESIEKVLSGSAGEEDFHVVLKKPSVKDLQVRVQGILKGMTK